MKRGDKVTVYEDPITMNKLEGEATVTKILDVTPMDVDGYSRLVYANVRFKGNMEVYPRWVKELKEKGA